VMQHAMHAVPHALFVVIQMQGNPGILSWKYGQLLQAAQTHACMLLYLVAKQSALNCVHTQDSRARQAVISV